MKKFLTEMMYILIILVGIAVSLKIAADKTGKEVVNNISGCVILLTIILVALWAITVLLYLFQEKIWLAGP